MSYFCIRYLYVRLDGTMSIKKRAKIVERFNNLSVSEASDLEIFSTKARPYIMSILTESAILQFDTGM